VTEGEGRADTGGVVDGVDSADGVVAVGVAEEDGGTGAVGADSSERTGRGAPPEVTLSPMIPPILLTSTTSSDIRGIVLLFAPHGHLCTEKYHKQLPLILTR
jgi:hypothetical protein